MDFACWLSARVSVRPGGGGRQPVQFKGKIQAGKASEESAELAGASTDKPLDFTSPCRPRVVRPRPPPHHQQQHHHHQPELEQSPATVSQPSDPGSAPQLFGGQTKAAQSCHVRADGELG